LAAESLTYTRGYVTSPLCRPSLASIFTGLHTPVHGITGNDLLDPEAGRKIGRGDPKWRVKHEELYEAFEENPKLAQLLTEAGYLTLQTGKWWENDPKRFGFTHAMTHGDPKRGGRHGDKGLEISRKGIAPIRNFLDEAEKAEKPFFIWHAPFLPHTPHNPPQELYDKYLAKEPNKFVARYYAMVEWFDQTCGELLAELEKRGVADDTLVIYVTDNGWIQSSKSGRYAPLSKQTPYEMGIRTPLMVRWPGKVKATMDKDTLVSSIDIAPTILKAAGVEVPEAMTGLDLRDTAALKSRDVVFGYDGHHNMRGVNDRTGNMETRYVIQGDWKFLLHHPENYRKSTYGGKFQGHPDNPEGVPELYNLKKDPFEKNNLAEEHPGKVMELTKVLNNWWKPEDQ